MAKRPSKPKIQIQAIPVEQRGLRFSVQFLQIDHDRFPIGRCPKEFFEALFREIARYQTFSVEAFQEACPAEHRHPIYFPGTAEPEGFPNIDPTSDDLWTDNSWQFGLSPDGKRYDGCGWRVHGFISEDVFYIVWFDPYHKLDPTPTGKKV